MTEPVEWGPRRPPAVSWAGLLLFAVALCQLIAIGVALLLDSQALFETPEYTIATAFVLAFGVLQLPAAVGVIRMGSGWRLFAIGLAVVGLVLQAANVAGAGGEPILVAINSAFALAYLVVLVLLFRSRDAFA